jgi:hypothetical protein
VTFGTLFFLAAFFGLAAGAGIAAGTTVTTLIGEVAGGFAGATGAAGTRAAGAGMEEAGEVTLVFILLFYARVQELDLAHLNVTPNRRNHLA